jgi:hypothetical protein
VFLQARLWLGPQEWSPTEMDEWWCASLTAVSFTHLQTVGFLFGSKLESNHFPRQTPECYGMLLILSLH